MKYAKTKLPHGQVVVDHSIMPSCLFQSVGPDDSLDMGPQQPGQTWVLLESLETSFKHNKDAAALADSMACQGFLWLLPTLHRTE